MAVAVTANPRLRQVCVICVEWGQVEPNCAHGLEDGVNPGSLYFVPARVLTLEIGVRASAAAGEENRVGRADRGGYIARLFKPRLLVGGFV